MGDPRYDLQAAKEVDPSLISSRSELTGGSYGPPTTSNAYKTFVPRKDKSFFFKAACPQFVDDLSGQDYWFSHSTPNDTPFNFESDKQLPRTLARMRGRRNKVDTTMSGSEEVSVPGSFPGSESQLGAIPPPVEQPATSHGQIFRFGADSELPLSYIHTIEAELTKYRREHGEQAAQLTRLKNEKTEQADLAAELAKLKREKQEQADSDYEQLTVFQRDKDNAENRAELATKALLDGRKELEETKGQLQLATHAHNELASLCQQADIKYTNMLDGSKTTQTELEKLTLHFQINLSELKDTQDKLQAMTRNRDDAEVMTAALHAQLDPLEVELEQLKAKPDENKKAKEDLDTVLADFKALFRDLGDNLTATDYIRHIKNEQKRQNRLSGASDDGIFQPLSLDKRGNDQRNVSGMSIQDELAGVDEYMSDDEGETPATDVVAKDVADAAIAAKDEEIATKVQEMVTKDTEIATKDQVIAELQMKVQEMVAKDYEITSKAQEMVTKDNEIATKAQEMVAKDQKLAVKDQEIAAKDQEIAAKDQELADKDQELDDKDQAMAELKTLKSNFNDDGRHLQMTVDKLNTAQKGHDTTIQSIKHTLNKRDIDIQNLNQTLAKRETEIQNLNQNLAKRDTTIGRLQNADNGGINHQAAWIRFLFWTFATVVALLVLLVIRQHNLSIRPVAHRVFGVASGTGIGSWWLEPLKLTVEDRLGFDPTFMG